MYTIEKNRINNNTIKYLLSQLIKQFSSISDFIKSKSNVTTYLKSNNCNVSFNLES